MAHAGPPSSCALPYENGKWTSSTTEAARRCIIDALHRDIDWWRHSSCPDGQTHEWEPPDIESTMCRLRGQNRHTVFTNMLLVRSHGGNLSALILVDPNDPRGPRKHWPGRTIGALQQLGELQQKIRAGVLPPLPEFVALLNPHDQPEQLAANGWCGLLPILSNSRTSGVHRDLMMPDYSFTSTMYLTNSLIANMSGQASVPQGWPTERATTYHTGARLAWVDRHKTLYWRGGDTHEVRKSYSDGLASDALRLPNGLSADTFLCDNHCTKDQGQPPSAWCANRVLLSLPGHSFAVGFKYTMLCGSLVVRGAHGARTCNSSACQSREVFEQWWQAGLRDGEHYAASDVVDDLPKVLARTGPAGEAIGRRGADYTFHVLSPAFILQYWHALLTGYASLRKTWTPPLTTPPSACKQPPPRAPLANPSLNLLEQTCLKGPKGHCQLGERFRAAAAVSDFVPILPPEQMAAESSSKRGLDHLYARHVHVLPGRFGGGSGITSAARTAMEASGLVPSSMLEGVGRIESERPGDARVDSTASA